MPKKVFETTTSVIAFIKSREWTYEQWIGVYEYSSVPYVRYVQCNGKSRILPVKYSVGFADGREHYEQLGCDTALAEAINGLAVGNEIVVPDYSGCNLDGQWIFVKCSSDSWSRRYIAGNR